MSGGTTSAMQKFGVDPIKVAALHPTFVRAVPANAFAQVLPVTALIAEAPNDQPMLDPNEDPKAFAVESSMVSEATVRERAKESIDSTVRTRAVAFRIACVSSE